MRIVKVFISGISSYIVAILLVSCNLKDFNLNKVVSPKDIVPVLAAPLAYGTYKVSDLAPTTPPIPDNSPIPSSGLSLNSLVLKTGIIFKSTAIDSIYLIVHVTNGTPCDMTFGLNFVNVSGTPFFQLSSSENIPTGAKDKEIKFGLGPSDQDRVQNATSIQLDFKLLPPNPGPITYGVIKSDSVTIKISFQAPVNLWRL